MSEGSEGSAMNTPTPIGKPQQPIEDRIHSFTDALMNEIRKHKAWKNAPEELLRGKGIKERIRNRYTRLHRNLDYGKITKLHVRRGTRRNEEGRRRIGGKNGESSIPYCG